MAEVFTTDEFAEWYRQGGLTAADQDDVDHVVELLAAMGLSLGSPHCSAIKGATFGLRELRPSAGRSSLRIFYAFDPSRDAVLIIGGDKANEPKFYERFVEKAERIWKEYLAERGDGHDSSKEPGR